MRKIAFVLAVLLLSASALATVTITATQIGGTNDVSITYAVTGEPNRVRAFALDISVDNGTIVGISDYNVGECNSVSKGYGIFPGTIDVNTGDGSINDVGSPVAPAVDQGALGGLGTSGITIEMGSLFDDDANAPADSGTLCKIKLSLTNGSATVDLEENTTRGGIVLENPGTSPASVVLVDEEACVGDCAAPTPNPATFSSAPSEVDCATITMTATTGTDASTPVEYSFVESSGNPGATSSGWVTNPVYVDSGLTESLQYSYTVQMRDAVGNTGSVSTPVANLTLGSCAPPECYEGPSLTEWRAVGSPPSWCLPYQCYGDGSGTTELDATGKASYAVYYNDIPIIAAQWGSSFTGDYRADFGHGTELDATGKASYAVYYDDLNKIATNWGASAPAVGDCNTIGAPH